MQLELKPEEADFLKSLLEKEIEETRVEVHHTRSTEFKTRLQARNLVAQSLFDRIKTPA